MDIIQQILVVLLAGGVLYVFAQIYTMIFEMFIGAIALIVGGIVHLMVVVYLKLFDKQEKVK